MGNLPSSTSNIVNSYVEVTSLGIIVDLNMCEKTQKLWHQSVVWLLSSREEKFSSSDRCSTVMLFIFGGFLTISVGNWGSFVISK